MPGTMLSVLYPLAKWMLITQWDVGATITHILHRMNWGSWTETKFSQTVTVVNVFFFKRSHCLHLPTMKTFL